MIDAKVVEVLNYIPLSKKLPIILESLNNTHPMAKPFILVGEVYSRTLGTPSKPLTSKTGEWVMSRTVLYNIRISIQGLKTEYISDLCEELKMLLDTPPIRHEFNDAGLAYTIDPQTVIIPIQLNTDQYIRHSFTLDVKTQVTTRYNMSDIAQAVVEGKLGDVGGVDHEYSEAIPETI